MVMRYHWGLGVGHTYAYRTREMNVPDSDSAPEVDDVLDDENI
jgi:hypothetical protein